MPDLYKKAHVTHVLIILNILVFILEEILGGSENFAVAVRFGVFYPPYILERHEWYRLITSMFMHFGAEHLGSNMISLFVIGPYVEHMLGRISYIFVYLFSGLSGNLLTLLVETMTGDMSFSAGASGAVCGLVGVFIILIIFKMIRGSFPGKNIALAIICILAPGIGNSSINLAAHIGGLIGGMLASAAVLAVKRLMAAARRE